MPAAPVAVQLGHCCHGLQPDHAAPVTQGPGQILEVGVRQELSGQRSDPAAYGFNHNGSDLF